MTSRMVNALSLALIIGIAIALRIYQIYYNSPFLDEATYILLGQKIWAGNYDTVSAATTWVGGFPFFYPFFTSLSYRLGGIIGARLFNTFLGILCVGLMAQLTQLYRFFPQDSRNRTAGWIAALLLAILPVPVFLSRFATYDMLAYTWYLGGLTVLAYALRRQSQEAAFLAGAAVFLGFMAKYIVGIGILPLGLWILIVLTYKRTTIKQKWILQEFSLILLFLILLYVSINYKEMWQYFRDQAAGSQGTYWEIITKFWPYSWIPYAIALGAVFFKELRTRFTLVLILASLFPFILQMATRTSVGMTQHSFISLIFLLPLAGAVCAAIISRFSWLGSAAVSGIICLVIWQSVTYRHALEHFWPDSTQAITLLTRTMTPQDTLLAESDDVFVLALTPRIPGDHIVGPFYFPYKNKEGYHAYKNAITDGYFTYIEFDNNFFHDADRANLEALMPGHYQQIFNDHTISIYRRQ